MSAGLIAAMSGSGLAVLAVALIATSMVLRRGRIRGGSQANPELSRARADIQSQIDAGRAGHRM